MKIGEGDKRKGKRLEERGGEDRRREERGGEGKRGKETVSPLMGRLGYTPASSSPSFSPPWRGMYPHRMEEKWKRFFITCLHT